MNWRTIELSGQALFNALPWLSAEDKTINPDGSVTCRNSVATGSWTLRIIYPDSAMTVQCVSHVISIDNTDIPTGNYNVVPLKDGSGMEYKPRKISHNMHNVIIYTLGSAVYNTHIGIQIEGIPAGKFVTINSVICSVRGD